MDRVREVSIVSSSSSSSSSTSSSDPYEVDLYKFTHVFRSLNSQIRFGVSIETNLPIIISAPIFSDGAGPFICLFDYTTTTTTTERSFTEIEHRLFTPREIQTQDNECDMTELLVGESMGHLTRQTASFTLDPVIRDQLFDKAYTIYEAVVLAICHSSLNQVIRDVRKKELKKAFLLQPFEKLALYTPDARRLTSHCFAGMALCVLMSSSSSCCNEQQQQQCMLKFISLASVSVCFEENHALELACTLSIFPLLMYSSFFSDPIQPLLQLLLLRMRMDVSEKVLLPLMLGLGRRDLFDVELGFVEQHRQLECEQFAQAIVARSPSSPLANVRTHVKDGKIVERNCAACGVWDRTGVSYRRCKACMMVYYCGKECQLAHWKMHKTVCTTK